MGGPSFTNVPNLTGGTMSDLFDVGPLGSISGTIDGTAGGTDTIDIADVAGAQTIDLQNSTIATVVNNFTDIEAFVGDDANDVLVGPNALNTWNITGANDGNVVGGPTFTNVPNLTGGTLGDTFDFGPAGSLSGTIDGTAGGTDTVDIADVPGAQTIDLQNTTIAGVLNDFSSIEVFVGDNTADVLVGPDAPNTWNITEANGGDVVGGPAFVNIPNLTGGNQNDTFDFAAMGSVTGTIDGTAGGTDTIDIADVAGAQVIDLQNTAIAGVVNDFAGIENFVGDDTNDVLVGPNALNVWNITGANDGNVVGGPTFTNVPNLTGGSMDDTFDFGPMGSISGTVDGTAGGTDTIDIADVAGNQTVDLVNMTIAGVVNSFVDIEQFIGDATGDVIVGPNAPNVWNITGVNEGNVVGGPAFTNVPNLTGGNMNDTFDFGPLGQITGTIDGTAGGTDTIDIADVAGAQIIDLQNSTIATVVNNFVDIEAFVGDDAMDVLVGPDAPTTFNVTDTNDGDLSGGPAFMNVPNLTGGNMDDVFDFGPAGSLTGTIDGTAGGTDTIDIADVVGAQTIDLQNTTIAGVVNDFADIESFVGDNTADFLLGPNLINMWTITGVNDGTVTNVMGTVNFTDVPNLTGGTNTDTFTFLNAGMLTGAIDGNAGTDRLVGDEDGNIFSITAADTGLLAGKTTGWSNIENLNGGSAPDTFTIQPAGSLTGDIVGGGGSDLLAQTAGANLFTIPMPNMGTVKDVGGTFSEIENLTGGVDNDTFTFTGDGLLDGTLDGANEDAAMTHDVRTEGTLNPLPLQLATNYVEGVPAAQATGDEVNLNNITLLNEFISIDLHAAGGLVQTFVSGGVPEPIVNFLNVEGLNVNTDLGDEGVVVRLPETGYDSMPIVMTIDGQTAWGGLFIEGSPQKDVAIIQPTGMVTRAAFEVANLAFVNVRGRGGDDTILNDTALPSLIEGGSGDDIVLGGDALINFGGAEPGTDAIFGGLGSDALFGNRGMDFLYDDIGILSITPYDGVSPIPVFCGIVNTVGGDLLACASVPNDPGLLSVDLLNGGLFESDDVVAIGEGDVIASAGGTVVQNGAILSVLDWLRGRFVAFNTTEVTNLFIKGLQAYADAGGKFFPEVPADVNGEGEFGLTNPLNALDVNDDGHVSPVDALHLINELNLVGSYAVGESPIEGEDPRDIYLDPNGDNFVSTQDVLYVVNFLNSGSEFGTPTLIDHGSEAEAEGEGEARVDAARAREADAAVVVLIGDDVTRDDVGSTTEHPEIESLVPVREDRTVFGTRVAESDLQDRAVLEVLEDDTFDAELLDALTSLS